MSTATPVIEAGGTYAAVMDQGAGEMNLAKAVTTKAYLTAEGTYSNRPKLELGDDPEKTGVYTLTFTVHNFGTTALNYTIDPSVLLEDIGLLGYMDEAQELPVIIYTGESWDIAAEGDEVLLVGQDNKRSNHIVQLQRQSAHGAGSARKIAAVQLRCQRPGGIRELQRHGVLLSEKRPK